MDDADPTAASADHTAATETSAGDPAPETAIVPNVSQPQAPDLAWSSDADTTDYGAPTERYTWRATWVRATAFAVSSVAVAGAIAGVWAWHRSAHARPVTTAAVAPTAVPATAVMGQVLDGVYVIASDNEHATWNGTAAPTRDLTRYWAFRSLCTPTACVATAAEVDDFSHQTPYPDHDHSTWHWTNGSWEEDPDYNTTPCPNGGPPATETMVRTLAPQPDGTLKGTETDNVGKGSCGIAAGGIMTRPITAKRIGDTPPGVVADPATVPAPTASPAAAPPPPS